MRRARHGFVAERLAAVLREVRMRLERDSIRHAPERGRLDLGVALVAFEAIDAPEHVPGAPLRQVRRLHQDEIEPVMRTGDAWQRAGDRQAREQ